MSPVSSGSKKPTVSIKSGETRFLGPHRNAPSSSSDDGQMTESERKCLDIQDPDEMARSEFDLPLEFHRKVMEDWQMAVFHKNIHALMRNRHPNFEKYILSRKTSIMYLCERRKPNRKSRFEFLKEEVLTKALKERPNFFDLRKVAIELLRKNFMLELNIVTNNQFCPNTPDVPHRLFSWSAEDFYDRRELDNVVWLDFYEKKAKDCMEVQKFKYDLEELQRYMDMLLCSCSHCRTSLDFENEVMQQLEDASDLLTCYERMKTEIIENRNHLHDLAHQHEMSDTRATTIEEGNRLNLIEQLADTSVIYPLTYRYQKSWYEAQADQVEIKNEIELNKHREEVNIWKDKILQETNAMQNALNMYYTQIEYYKSRINDFTVKFESEYEDLENAISYKKLSMGKLETQRKYYAEQMELFREELERMRARKRIEEEEKRRLAQARAEMELLKLAKAEKRKQKEEAKKNKKKR